MAQQQEQQRQRKNDINHASREDLMSVEGIGETMAESIIRYREEHGQFQSIEDVRNVPGINEARLDHLREAFSAGAKG